MAQLTVSAGNATKASDLNKIIFDEIALTSDTIIADVTSSTSYNQIYSCKTGASNITITLPTLADNYDRIIEVIKSDADIGYVALDGEGGETINGNAQVYLWHKYDRIKIYASENAGEWIILDQYFLPLDTGWISTNDWTNRHLGLVINYDNLSGSFTVGETITEAVSGYTAKILYDTGSALTVVNLSDSGGVFTDGRELTGSDSGATADVNEGTGSTKNVDANFRHGFNCDLSKLIIQLYYSDAGSVSDAIIDSYAGEDGANRYGWSVLYIDANTIKIQTALTNMSFITDAGNTSQLDTEDDYFRIVVYFKGY